MGMEFVHGGMDLHMLALTLMAKNRAKANMFTVQINIMKVIGLKEGSMGLVPCMIQMAMYWKGVYG